MGHHFGISYLEEFAEHPPVGELPDLLTTHMLAAVESPWNKGLGIRIGLPGLHLSNSLLNWPCHTCSISGQI